MNSRQHNRQIMDGLRREALADGSLAGSSPPLREARVFARILDEMPIFHVPGDRLAGDFGWRQEDADALARRFPAAHAAPPTDSPDAETRMRAGFHCFGGYAPAHTCVDYAKLLRLGLDGMLEELAAAGDGEYRDAMAVSLRAMLKLSERHATLLDESGEPELAALCRRVPRRPADSFIEALQSIWLAHWAIGISEYSDASISLGRFDQYAYPYYRQSLDAGCSEAAMERQFAALVAKLNRYGDAACALNLGGVAPDGSDLCNDLTRLILRVVKREKMPAPILAARIHPEFPSDIFDELIDSDLFAIGQPTFYGEFSCRDALRERGVPEGELARWAVNSCMGLLIEGCEVSNMWGAVVHLLLPLELTVNGGRPFRSDLPIALATPPLERAETFECVWGKFLDYLAEIAEFSLRACLRHTREVREERPNPYLSALLNSCVARGRDRIDGGADYHVAIVEAFGLVNAADALLAIKTLVFEQGRFGLDELAAAAKDDYRGHGRILAAIRALPKFGNGQPEADALTAKLADEFQRMVRSRSEDGILFAPSFHTLNAHVFAGSRFGASLDGRRDGKPLAKNIGVMPGNAAEGLTALVRSATAIDQKKFFGGQALDISIPADRLRPIEEKRKIQALIQTYFALGGLQLQVNGLSAETLAKAIANPDDYRDLIVRIGGFSDYFNNLSLDVRREMAERLQQGL